MVVRDATIGRAAWRQLAARRGRQPVRTPPARLRRRDRATNTHKSGPPPAAWRGAERHPEAKEA